MRAGERFLGDCRDEDTAKIPVPRELIVCQLEAAWADEEAMCIEACFQASNLDSAGASRVQSLEAEFVEMRCPDNSTLATE